jgi:hypothetical protein
LEEVDQRALPQGGVAWRTERGCMGLWVPCPQVLVISFQGHGDAELTAPAVAAYETLDHSGLVHLFVDAENLVNYDSRLRTDLTARFFPDRERFGAFKVLVKSKIVAMGASVANLALGGIIDILNGPETFKSGLETCLFEKRVVGFSSNALQSMRFASAAAQA